MHIRKIFLVYSQTGTCRDLALSQDEDALSFFNVNVFIKFFIVAPKPLFGVFDPDDSRVSGCASKHF